MRNRQHSINPHELENSTAEALIACGNTWDAKFKRMFLVTTYWPDIRTEFVIRQKDVEDKVYHTNTEAFEAYNEL